MVREVTWGKASKPAFTGEECSHDLPVLPLESAAPNSAPSPRHKIVGKEDGNAATKQDSEANSMLSLSSLLLKLSGLNCWDMEGWGNFSKCLTEGELQDCKPTLSCKPSCQVMSDRIQVNSLNSIQSCQYTSTAHTSADSHYHFLSDPGQLQCVCMCWNMSLTAEHTVSQRIQAAWSFVVLYMMILLYLIRSLPRCALPGHLMNALLSALFFFFLQVLIQPGTRKEV